MSANNTPQSSISANDNHFVRGLKLLWQAHTYARDAGADFWDFALEIERLHEEGLTNSDLRWLVAKGFAEYGVETTAVGHAHRSFRVSNGFNLQPATCLILTSRGAVYANSIMERFGLFPLLISSMDSAAPAQSRSGLRVESSPRSQPNAHLKPHWNPQRRESWLADTVVKRFRVPAPNQQRILCAFEEENWPEHIDDPLPVHARIDPPTRLHDAINRLNGCQTRPLLRFHGNGRGTGVSWKLRNSG